MDWKTFMGSTTYFVYHSKNDPPTPQSISSYATPEEFLKLDILSSSIYYPSDFKKKNISDGATKSVPLSDRQVVFLQNIL